MSRPENSTVAARLRKVVAGLSLAVFASGCSLPSDSIEARQVSTVPYWNLSCNQLASEIRRNAKRLEEVVKVHNREHSRDTVGVVGGFVWWPLWLLMVTGSDDRTEAIGLLKGEANVLADITRAKQCP